MERCPACGSEAVARPGAEIVGELGALWWKRPFRERLYRCEQGHHYSVREERRRGRPPRTAVALHDDVDDWIRARTGAEPLKRPPGM